MSAYKPPTGGGDMLGSGELGNLSFGEQLGGGSGAGFGGITPQKLDFEFTPIDFSKYKKKY